MAAVAACGAGRGGVAASASARGGFTSISAMASATALATASAAPWRRRSAVRRGRRRMFESGELRLVLLKLIADEPRHGYQLIKAIEELTEGDYAPSPGVVYPTLTMLDDMGLIAEKQVEGRQESVRSDRRGPRPSGRE